MKFRSYLVLINCCKLFYLYSFHRMKGFWLVDFSSVLLQYVLHLNSVRWFSIYSKKNWCSQERLSLICSWSKDSVSVFSCIVSVTNCEISLDWWKKNLVQMIKILNEHSYISIKFFQAHVLFYRWNLHVARGEWRGAARSHCPILNSGTHMKWIYFHVNSSFAFGFHLSLSFWLLWRFSVMTLKCEVAEMR